jgi:hypothetical protein
MQPNPFTLWGITGIPGHTRHRALLSDAGSTTPSDSRCTQTTDTARHSKQPPTAGCLHKTAVPMRSALSVPALVRASRGGALPVQGRVSVRESQLGGDSSTQSSAPVVPGTSSIVDEDITAVVPGVPAQASTPAGTPQAQTGSSPLSPALIACVSVGVFVAALFTIIMLRRRQNRRDRPLRQPPPMQFDVYTIQPQRPTGGSRSGRVCTPRDVKPYTGSDVSFTEVQQLSAGETSFDSSWGGRALLPPARDSDPGWKNGGM